MLRACVRCLCALYLNKSFDVSIRLKKKKKKQNELDQIDALDEAFEKGVESELVVKYNNKREYVIVCFTLFDFFWALEQNRVTPSPLW